MAIEKIRGCGYRKVGAIYIVGTGISLPCDRLPYNLTVCPVCGQGIKFSMGFTWLQPDRYFQGKHTDCKDQFPDVCPLCNPKLMGEKAGLLWVGGAFYTPKSFVEEAERMGVSKRIGYIPRDLKLGETWVLLAHKKAGIEKVPVENNKRQTEIVKYKTKKCPAIFYAFKPQRVEMLVWESELTDEKKEELEKRGITPIPVPDNDPDHNPKRTIYKDLKLEKERKKGKQERLQTKRVE
jgi:hypothetical protein